MRRRSCRPIPPTPAGVNPVPDKPVSRQRQRRHLRPLQQRRHRLRRARLAPMSRTPRPTSRSSRTGAATVFASSRLIRPSAHGPLVDITAPGVPRVFPCATTSRPALQPSGATEGWTANPVDDQNTAYGLTGGAGPPGRRSLSPSASAAWSGNCASCRRRAASSPIVSTRTFEFDTASTSATRSVRRLQMDAMPRGRRWKNRNPKASSSTR